ncbi:OLC1v1032716C1 [Oldenlandia corymbosa var. corymbosa]|uniref:OLC1v1032716C1 n=1 Tax=Oldenlandia corymbosa var. corymbosa TaxID=529605 RepID=A0AAV1CNG3_OLDCO|nr:OLC1v1032716C1 [Oldenlandia corymbosa var. corymbosa]
MGRLRLQSSIKAIEEEPEDCEATSSSKAAIASMVNSEVGALLSIMRRNVRWGGRYVSGDDQLEHSLIQSLKTLRKQIFSWQHHWDAINPVLYLQPFLDVIKSDETGAPITSVALSSVYKILTLDVLDLSTANIADAMHLVVDSVTSCRFTITDPASEEVVFMKVLQVLLACMKGKTSVVLSNQHVCNIVKTCILVVQQARTKGELLQGVARHTMHELVRCIFSHLPDVDKADRSVVKGSNSIKPEVDGIDADYSFIGKENGSEYESQLSSGAFASAASAALSDNFPKTDNGKDTVPYELHPYGVPCMVETFYNLCKLLVEHEEMGPRANSMAFDEDEALFALGLINSAIELGGPAIRRYPRLLSLVQDALFSNLMHFSLSMSPLILSMVCSIVLNLYQHLRMELKLQLEAFFTCVILRLSQSRFGASYQQQEVAMEALVDFCRQKTFMVEMYANLDCDITCSNVFEELANLLSKSAFPVNSPLSAMHILALDGLIAVIQGMAERVGNGSFSSEYGPVNLEEYTPFWMLKCENYNEPDNWVPFVRKRKYIKRRLMIGADHFNRDPKKGLEFLQGTHLLPEKLDPQSVACFFRYTAGLDKNLVGDFLGNHDEFCVQVLHEFARTFDFQDMKLDTALRLFLETFRLPGESQKIQRVLEAFSERYYEQSPQILANKDAALLLSYSLIMLNTDQHNVQVKKKMTEEDFIRNNRLINGGSDLPREFLSELYYSICKNEIRTTPEQGSGFSEMTPSRWIDLMHKSKKSAHYIVSDSRAYLDHDMFAIMSGPTIAAISVVFDHAEHEEVYQTCIDGFLAVAKISACHHLEDVLDDLVVSLCKFTTLLNPSPVEEPVLAFGDDIKARMATVTVFTIANRYGDFIRTGWRNILDCILRLHKLGLLPARVASDAADDSDMSPEPGQGKPLTNSLSSVQVQAIGTPRRSSGLMGRFSQLLSLDTEEPRSQPTEQQLAAHQRTLQTIQKCHIDSIFTESKFLLAESLLQLARALIWAAGRPQKGNSSPEDEDTAVFCLELLIAITLNNRDRIGLLWQGVYEHIASIVQSTVMPCALVEKAVFGLLRICQRLLPYKENLADELLRSLQLVLKLDGRVADAYCEQITQEVNRLVKANASHIKTQMGWRTITSLLSFTARHLEASEPGFDALLFIMSDGAHLSPANYVLCIDSARQFAESRVGQVERSVRAVDLMAGSVTCLTRWDEEAKGSVVEVDAMKVCQEIGEMWLRLTQALRKVCLDQREEVRNHALLSLQMCLTGVEGVKIPHNLWLQCFDMVIFTMLDDLIEIAQGHSQKDYRNMEGTLVLALKLLSKVFLQLLVELSQLTTFCKLWLGVLSRMGKYMMVKVRGKKSDKLQELVPELLKNAFLVMKTKGVLVQRSALGGDSLWELTRLHVHNNLPSLESDLFPDKDSEPSNQDQGAGLAFRVTVEVLLACMKGKTSVLLSNQDVCKIVKTCILVIQQALAKDVDKADLSFLKGSNSMVDGVDADYIFIGKEKGDEFGSQLSSEDFTSSTALSGVPVDSLSKTDIEKGAVPYDLLPFGILCMVETFYSLSVELGGPAIRHHPQLLSLVQDSLFSNLMHFSPSMSPPILSIVCSIVLNLYQHLRVDLKLQLEAFFTCVILRLSQSRYGASYLQQEVAMETLVDFCRQNTFMAEMYANFDCDITCSNVFEQLVNLLCQSAFPVNSPLSAIHILALDGLIAVIQGMAERIGHGSFSSEYGTVTLEEFAPFWMLKCENYNEPDNWVPFVRKRKYIKRRLMIGADHFNRDPKKGFEFLLRTHLLPEKLDPQSVACFFRYTAGSLPEFARTFDFKDMNLDTALRLFLETFRLHGEPQQIQRVLEAFSERYYEQSPQILANEDVVFVVSYSLIMLNTDRHNVQVKNKMTEEAYIRNLLREYNLSPEFLSELYNSVRKNEIQVTPEQGAGFAEMTPCRWIDLMHKSKRSTQYIVSDSRAYLDLDMFLKMSSPTVFAISEAFDNAEDEDVCQTCIDGFLAVAKISAFHCLEDVLYDLVVSLCKFTTLLNPSTAEEPVLAFGGDIKAQMATITVFTIANRYGDFLHTGWRNILDCILKLHKLGLLPARLAGNAADNSDMSLEPGQVQAIGTPRRSSGLMRRFSQLLSLDPEEPKSQPREQQLAAHEWSFQTIQKCQIDSIFAESRFLLDDSLLQLAGALAWASGRPQKGSSSPEDEDTAVFCLELLIAITLNNRDRIGLLWQVVYEHIANTVQSTVTPCALVEKAIFGIFHICQRLLPYKENLADELLRSLQLILKLEARIADAYCEHITQEFAESQIGQVERSVRAVDLMAGSVVCLTRWDKDSKGCTMQVDAMEVCQEIGEMWLRLTQALRKVCLDQREEVRNHALLSQQMWLSGVEGVKKIPHNLWLQCFDMVIFTMLDDLIAIAQGHSQKDYRNMEGTLVLALKLLSKVFLQLLVELSQLTTFCQNKGVAYIYQA